MGEGSKKGKGGKITKVFLYFISRNFVPPRRKKSGWKRGEYPPTVFSSARKKKGGGGGRGGRSTARRRSVACEAFLFSVGNSSLSQGERDAAKRREKVGGVRSALLCSLFSFFRCVLVGQKLFPQRERKKRLKVKGKEDERNEICVLQSIPFFYLLSFLNPPYP